MTLPKSTILLLAPVCAVMLAQTPITGTLTRSDTGRPIAHAIIHAASTTAVPKSGQIFRTETAWDGSFVFGTLPAGSYRFCVHNLDLHLNPCEWPTANAALPIRIAGSDPKLRLKVDPGRRVHIRVADPTAILSTPTAAGRLPELSVVVVDKSGKVWRPIPVLGKASAGHYSLVVPSDPAYGFAVLSRDVYLADHVGATVADLAFRAFADPVSTSVAAASTLQGPGLTRPRLEEPAVLLTVSGRKP